MQQANREKQQNTTSPKILDKLTHTSVQEVAGKTTPSSIQILVIREAATSSGPTQKWQRLAHGRSHRQFGGSNVGMAGENIGCQL